MLITEWSGSMKSLIIASLCVALAVPALAASPQEEKVEKVVVLMRHGVRPPTSYAEVSPLAARSWPEFGAKEGMLTPHGSQAARHLGAWEGRWLAARGVLAAPKCPAPGEVWAWSSRALQRTTDTGIAFLDGMFPGCRIPVGKASGSGADGLFTAAETDVGRLDPAQGRAAIEAATGPDFAVPRARLATLLGEMQAITDCCRPEICQKFVGHAQCTLTDLPWGIVPAAGGRNLAISGPMSLSATMAQVFLLEYANGLPPARIAWGHVAKAADIVRLSRIRQIKYEYFERVPYIARRGASNILAQLDEALFAGSGQASGLDLSGPPDARFTLFVGSDTQIAEIGGILGLHWFPESYLADETPPTGGLVFERVRDTATGERAVRVNFITPRLEQIRAAAVFDAAHPPEVLPVTVPDCTEQMRDGVCPLGRFGEIVRNRIDRGAVAAPSYQ